MKLPLKKCDHVDQRCHGTLRVEQNPNDKVEQLKIAIMSDIHGFSLALDRVLADIQGHDGIDRVIAAGDLCETGPDPVGVLERLARDDVELLQGNTDRDLASRSRDSRAASWTAAQLGDERLRFLGELPFEIRITPPGASPLERDLLVVHANPVDMDRHLPPDLPEPDAMALIKSAHADVIAFGHLHVAYVRRIGDVTLMDVSAVGNPKDGDLRSKWGLASWHKDERRWHVELQYVDYPLEDTIQQIQASDMPNQARVTRKLVRASYED